jgi:hypothetical protein
MSTIRKLNAFLEYDEGEMTIRIIDAVIEIGIYAWGVPLCLSLDRDNADLLIKVKNAPNTACTPTSGDPLVEPAFSGW